VFDLGKPHFIAKYLCAELFLVLLSVDKEVYRVSFIANVLILSDN
jgi:hypothetical protein